jgi:hypothetical protein
MSLLITAICIVLLSLVIYYIYNTYYVIQPLPPIDPRVRSDSFFAQYTQDVGRLDLENLDCSKITTTTDDTWGWLYNTLSETLTGRRARPQSDNDFTKVLAGQ